MVLMVAMATKKTANFAILAQFLSYKLFSHSKIRLKTTETPKQLFIKQFTI